MEKDAAQPVKRPVAARTFVGLHLPFAGFTFTGEEDGRAPDEVRDAGQEATKGMSTVDALKHKSLVRRNSLLMAQNKMLQRASLKRNSAESPRGSFVGLDSPLGKGEMVPAAELRAAKKDIEQLERRLADSNEHLKEALKFKGELGTSLTSTEQTVAEKERVATALRDRLQEMEADMAELEEATLKHRQAAKHARQEAEDLQAENDSLQDRLLRVTALSKQHTAHSAEAEQAAAQLQESLDEARVAARAADAKLFDAEQRYDSQTTALAQEKARAAAFEVQVQKLRAELEDVMAKEPEPVQVDRTSRGAMLAAQAEVESLRSQLQEQEAAAERKAEAFNEELERYRQHQLVLENDLQGLKQDQASAKHATATAEAFEEASKAHERVKEKLLQEISLMRDEMNSLSGQLDQQSLRVRRATEERDFEFKQLRGELEAAQMRENELRKQIRASREMTASADTLKIGLESRDSELAALKQEMDATSEELAAAEARLDDQRMVRLSAADVAPAGRHAARARAGRRKRASTWRHLATGGRSRPRPCRPVGSPTLCVCRRAGDPAAGHRAGIHCAGQRGGPHPVGDGGAGVAGAAGGGARDAAHPGPPPGAPPARGGGPAKPAAGAGAGRGQLRVEEQAQPQAGEDGVAPDAAGAGPGDAGEAGPGGGTRGAASQHRGGNCRDDGPAPRTAPATHSGPGGCEGRRHGRRSRGAGAGAGASAGAGEARLGARGTAAERV